ncbi:probable UDP-N-acetylglucosamine--peptide N-acetylglucosaminyltransferase SEC [Sesamum indicum]|uniref:Probable UDP-N-acetylglucosamine--peptide N-acetylglucosaminyltransferase SEC n=1 Tax=Sesamum indicum TaxID=4182 RepID=A0A6I9TMY6_SESIN|nr:probable UDP-N-acetylglucosamine--peptide N-acetylglucosaminyltransferase SEC [Sesamum indicum]
MEATTNTSAHHFLLPSSHHLKKQAINITAKASSSPYEKKDKIEIRVCTNRTCRKQGSLEVLQVLSGIAPPFVTVNSCGCLGRCGSGPNIVILPEAVFVAHCGTPTKAATTMSIACGVDDDGDVGSSGKKCLEALALRKRAEEETGRGDFAQAYSLLSQAIDLKPFGGLHIMYKDRSAARLAMGDINGALKDAKEAMTLAPQYPEAYICKGDVLMAMDHCDVAEECYLIALDLDPSIRRSKSFKAKMAKLQEKLAPANLD